MDRTSLLKGHIEICVLAILLSGRSYGYEIMNELEKYNLKLKGVGSIYPVLTKLKEAGWVNTQREISKNGKMRVYYAINDEGEAFLHNKVREWLALQKDIQALLSDHFKEGI